MPTTQARKVKSPALPARNPRASATASGSNKVESDEVLVGDDESVGSVSLGKGLPSNVVKQLLEDIENPAFGGIEVLKLPNSKQALRNLLGAPSRRKIYGKLGDFRRRQISNKVDKWKNKNNGQYLTVLAQYGVTPCSVATVSVPVAVATLAEEEGEDEEDEDIEDDTQEMEEVVEAVPISISTPTSRSTKKSTASHLTSTQKKSTNKRLSSPVPRRLYSNMSGVPLKLPVDEYNPEVAEEFEVDLDHPENNRGIAVFPFTDVPVNGVLHNGVDICFEGDFRDIGNDNFQGQVWDDDLALFLVPSLSWSFRHDQDPEKIDKVRDDHMTTLNDIMNDPSRQKRLIALRFKGKMLTNEIFSPGSLGGLIKFQSLPIKVEFEILQRKVNSWVCRVSFKIAFKEAKPRRFNVQNAKAEGLTQLEQEMAALGLITSGPTKAEREQAKREKAEKDRRAKEQAEKDRRAVEAAKAKAERGRRAQEQAERDRQAKEQAERDRQAKEQAEKAAKEQAEKAAKEQAEKTAKEHAEKTAKEAAKQAKENEKTLLQKESEKAGLSPGPKSGFDERMDNEKERSNQDKKAAKVAKNLKKGEKNRLAKLRERRGLQPQQMVKPGQFSMTLEQQFAAAAKQGQNQAIALAGAGGDKSSDKALFTKIDKIKDDLQSDIDGLDMLDK